MTSRGNKDNWIMRLTTAMMPLLVASTLLVCCNAAYAQMGQSAMTPAGGLVNGAVSRFAELDANGPGWMYWGLNAVDRGLGYNGSYMTLGGFIPMSEDDLGGFWSADLRSHLSVYGGFFSNVGMVRKQFLGGTLLGVGVYWDYDGDQNQYPTGGAPGTGQYGQFGHAYNQVGVSGEWLTDFGNLRSNGYIPVGTTAYTVGAPGMPFVGNQLLCQYGLDAALAGADLEVGAYIPGLADWAGMISVGGYTFGNARYNWGAGSQVGQDVVPFFGGVYTRLDLTLIKNWDFSLQYNNDSYFDSTGFARLTYRMGGSRRRNVPDQMEQPMMRNEHIVRAHQTPVVAINPETGTPWRVIHVDNSARPLGSGSYESPVQSLAAAQSLATNPYDIVFVHAGKSAAEPYESQWQFQADNQFLIGQGSTLALNTATCGYKQFFTSSTAARPILSATGTAAIALGNGAVVDHLTVNAAGSSLAAIGADSSLTGVANVNDVVVTSGSSQVGVGLIDVPGTVNLTNMLVQNSGRGLVVNAGSPTVNFQGTISGTGASGEAISVRGMNNGTVNVNRTSNVLDTSLARNTAVTQSFGVIDVGSNALSAILVSSNTNSQISIGQSRIQSPNNQGVELEKNRATSVTFDNLVVINSVAQSFFSNGNDAATDIKIQNASALSSQSDTLAAFQTQADNAKLDVSLASLISNVPNAAGIAISLQGAPTAGELKVTETFTVGGAPGTEAANVFNAAGVNVTVP
jgi:hypothetical protein